MIEFNGDYTEFLSHEVKELTPEELKEQQTEMDKQYKKQQLKDVEKVKRVLSHIGANTNYPLRDLVAKFDLDWEIAKEFKNGISRVGFLAGNETAFELHLPTSEWFR